MRLWLGSGPAGGPERAQNRLLLPICGSKCLNLSTGSVNTCFSGLFVQVFLCFSARGQCLSLKTNKKPPKANSWAPLVFIGSTAGLSPYLFQTLNMLHLPPSHATPPPTPTPTPTIRACAASPFPAAGAHWQLLLVALCFTDRRASEAEGNVEPQVGTSPGGPAPWSLHQSASLGREAPIPPRRLRISSRLGSSTSS